MIAECLRCAIVSVAYLAGVFVLLIAIVVALALRRLVQWAWPALFVVVTLIIIYAWVIIIGSLL